MARDVAPGVSTGRPAPRGAVHAQRALLAWDSRTHGHPIAGTVSKSDGSPDGSSDGSSDGSPDGRTLPCTHFRSHTSTDATPHAHSYLHTNRASLPREYIDAVDGRA